MRRTGNTIFITGGTSGIGRGFAEALHRRGHKVIISGRRRNLLDDIVAANPGMAALEMDITDPASINRVAGRLIADFPDLNVLINNAGIMPFDDAAGRIDDADMESVLTTNFMGPVRMTSSLIEHLKAQPAASVMYVTSVLAFLPLASNALYSATKAALHSYIMSQRFQLRATNVQVQEISPPWVDTDLMGTRGDPRALSLEDYLAQTLDRLWNDEPELVVEQLQSFRNNPGPDEHAMVNSFNESFFKNPIRTRHDHLLTQAGRMDQDPQDLPLSSLPAGAFTL